MNWIDIGGVLLIGVIILLYIVLLPMIEGNKSKGKGNRFGILNEIGKKIKDIVRWINRQ